MFMKILNIYSNEVAFFACYEMQVQRLPRYKLLLGELLDETPDNHPDYKNIEVCLSQKYAAVG